MDLRDPEDRDEGELLTLWRELMDHHARLDPRFELGKSADARFRDYLDVARAREDYRVRVAELKGEVAGFIVACVLPNSPVYAHRWIGYINDLCVTERHRGQGVGRALVEDASNWLLSSGADRVEVYVALANEQARSFWRRMGAAEYLERLVLLEQA
ncbi:MAG: GNAT family N-acetyltransferase [Myxococcota bacterium]